MCLGSSFELVGLVWCAGVRGTGVFRLTLFMDYSDWGDVVPVSVYCVQKKCD